VRHPRTKAIIRELFLKITTVFAIGLALAGVLSAAPVQAQATRTFVSPTGSDASVSCSLAAPCRTFGAAYALTNAGGEIAVLGTAGYGSLAISKAISIVNGGGFEAGIAVPAGGIGITINAGTNDAVSLRGLTIDGAGVGQIGITFNGGKSLTVENCVVRHFTQYGINLAPIASSSLLLSNTLVADNSGTGIIGVPSGPGGYALVFDNVKVVNNNGNGIFVDGTSSTGVVTASINNSLASGNGTNIGAVGFYVGSNPGKAPTTMTVSHSVAVNNGIGFYAQNSTGAILRITQSTVTGNASGWGSVGGGILASYGDNSMDGNGANSGSLTSVAKQ
jgi:Right handed beta helix region